MNCFLNAGVVVNSAATIAESLSASNLASVLQEEAKRERKKEEKRAKEANEERENRERKKRKRREMKKESNKGEEVCAGTTLLSRNGDCAEITKK